MPYNAASVVIRIGRKRSRCGPEDSVARGLIPRSRSAARAKSIIMTASFSRCRSQNNADNGDNIEPATSDDQRQQRADARRRHGENRSDG